MDETAAYLRLLALPPLRLLTGLRSADGACVPRCLLQPSPRHPGSKNNFHFHLLLLQSRLHVGWFYAPPRPHPRGLHETCGFSALLRPRPLLCSCVRLTVPLPRCLLIQRACLFPEIQLEVGNRASALASPRGGPASESGWSFPMLGALTHRVRAVNDGGNQKRISSPPPVQTPLTMFVQQENTQQLSSPPSPSRFTACCSVLVLLLLLLPFCSVLDRPLSVPPAGKRSCSAREDWLSDTATLTDPPASPHY